MIKHLPGFLSYKIFPVNSQDLPSKFAMWQNLRRIYFRFFRNCCYMLVFPKLVSSLFTLTAFAQNFRKLLHLSLIISTYYRIFIFSYLAHFYFVKFTLFSRLIFSNPSQWHRCTLYKFNYTCWHSMCFGLIVEFSCTLEFLLWV